MSNRREQIFFKCLFTPQNRLRPMEWYALSTFTNKTVKKANRDRSMTFLWSLQSHKKNRTDGDNNKDIFKHIYHFQSIDVVPLNKDIVFCDDGALAKQVTTNLSDAFLCVPSSTLHLSISNHLNQ